MQKQTRTLAFIAVSLLVSCTNNQNEQREFTFTPRIDKTQDNYSFEDLYEEFKYIKLQTSEDCLLGEIKQIEIYKSRIFILTKEIYCFDMEGRFLYSLNEKGRGPSEFIQLLNFSISNDIIYLNSPRKLLCYSTESGQFLNSFKIEYPLLFLGYDGKYTYIDRLGMANKYVKGKERVLIATIKNQKPIKMFFSEERYHQGNVLNQLSGYNNNFYFIDRFFMRVYKLNEGRVENYISFDFGELNPTENDINILLSKHVTHYEGYNKPFQLENVFESPLYIRANVMLRGTQLTILFNKQTGKTITLELFKSRDLKMYQVSPGSISSVYEDYFCSILPADLACLMKEVMKEKRFTLEKDHPDFHMYSTIISTQVTDNPILILFKYQKSLWY